MPVPGAVTRLSGPFNPPACLRSAFLRNGQRGLPVSLQLVGRPAPTRLWWLANGLGPCSLTESVIRRPPGPFAPYSLFRSHRA
jgi:hypothetical protein